MLLAGDWGTIAMKKALVLLSVLAAIALVLLIIRARGAGAGDEALFVPVIVSPSVQPVGGQVLLFKATNVTEAPVGVRLMLFNDRDGIPAKIKDFSRIAPGATVSYLYDPPKTTLAVNEAEVQVPEAVRAVFAPLPGDDPGAIRRVVANVQILRLQQGVSPPALDPSIIVPLERCRFEPRGFVPYTGGQWVWNCAPRMSPVTARR